MGRVTVIKASVVVALALVMLAIVPWLVMVGSALVGDVRTYLALVPLSVGCYWLVRFRDWQGARRERRTTLERVPHDPRPASGNRRDRRDG